MNPVGTNSDRRTGWRDDPISEPRQDTLERAPFAVHAADLIKSNHSPDSSVVYGLQGPWGSGKSSVIALIASYLDEAADRPWHVVHFTPWATSGTEALFEEFFAALSAAMPDTTKDAKAHERFRSYAEIARPIAAMIPVVGAGLVEASRTVETRLRQPWNVAFGEVSEDLRQLNAAILVVVDDIDRLQPNELRDLLKVVRLLGRFPGVDFLLAYDERTVVETLRGAEQGTLSLARSREFMEKIVQYPLTMPPLLTSKIVKMLDTGLTEIVTPERVESSFDRPRFSRMIWDVMPNQLATPRAIARFLAQVEQQFAVHSPEEIDDVDLVLATFLRMQFPDLFAKLQEWKGDLTHGSSAWLLGRTPNDKGPNWAERLVVVDGDRNRSDAHVVLEALFPAVNNRNAERAAPRRFAHPDYFDRYLAQAIPEGDIPDATVSLALLEAAAGRPEPLRALIFAADDEAVGLALSKIRARYPDVAFHRVSDGAAAPLNLELLSIGMTVVDQVRDRREGWTSDLSQATYWMANVIRALLHVDPTADLSVALSSCTHLDRRAHVVSTALSDSEPLPEGTRAALKNLLEEVATDLIEPLMVDLRAKDESTGLAGSPWLYGLVEEAGLLPKLQEQVQAGLAANAFTLEDVAARFVGFAYIVGGSGDKPSSASFSGQAFTRLTGVSAGSTDHSNEGEWSDTSWATRREFASAFVQSATDLQPN